MFYEAKARKVQIEIKKYAVSAKICTFLLPWSEHVIIEYNEYLFIINKIHCRKYVP